MTRWWGYGCMDPKKYREESKALLERRGALSPDEKKRLDEFVKRMADPDEQRRPSDKDVESYKRRVDQLVQNPAASSEEPASSFLGLGGWRTRKKQSDPAQAQAPTPVQAAPTEKPITSSELLMQRALGVKFELTPQSIKAAPKNVRKVEPKPAGVKLSEQVTESEAEVEKRAQEQLDTAKPTKPKPKTPRPSPQN